MDTDEFENIDDAFRGAEVAVVADESVWVVKFEVAEELRMESGIEEATDDVLRKLSSSLVVIWMFSLLIIPAECIERFLAGRDMIVLCLSFMKLVPVIA